MSSPYSFKNLSSHNKFWLKLVSSIFLVVLTFTIILYLREQFPELNNNNSISSILGFSLLININIIVVLILVFLVVKNLLTLVLERKRKILGSRLRTRLVTAFVGLSLIPTVMLFLVAKGILESVLQAWFSPQIVASVEGALSVAQHYSNATVAELSSESKFIGNKLVKDFPKLQNLKNDNIALRDAHLLDVKSFLVEKREELNLFSLAIYNLEGEELLSTVNEEQAQLDKIPPIKKNYLERAKSKEVFVKTEPFAKGELARGFAPIIFNQDRIEYILVVSTLISAELSHKLNTVINSYDDYKELRTYRRPLASTYLLTLVVVTLLIVFT
ncbi:MAG: hypothetical protein KBC84_11575, partial [Proteobacteria bacterium]|nr:hypothetical protein [Pseudomonadota bacterium]